MIVVHGMSEQFGKLSVSAHEINRLSSRLRSEIDDEVRRILDQAYRRVSDLLRQKETEFRSLARTVLDRDTLNAAEIVAIVENANQQRL